MPLCPLCKKSVSRFKTNSHVIPEWMYKEIQIYDEKGRIVHVNLQSPKKNLIQKGYRGDFICGNCEEKTAMLDNYASLIFKNKNSYPKGVKKEQKYDQELRRQSVEDHLKQIHLWSGFDFKKIQNFIYSICLRQHFYNLSKGNKGIVIDRHLHALLRLYHSDRIDDESYPIIIFSFSKDSKFHKIMIPPYADKMSGHHIIQFGACGFQFIVKTSAHSSNLFSNEIRLKYPGSIYIGQIPPETSNMVKKTISHFKNRLQQQ